MENKFVVQNITCKNCGKIHQVNCYPIINFQYSDKEFINSVFNLELFKVHCDCGADTIIQYDTVIIDMYKKYIIYLYLNGTEEDFYKEAKPTLVKMFEDNEDYKKAYNELNHTRLVSSINDMLEKLLIYDYDLDDRIIEIIKYSLLHNDKFKNDNIALLYFDKLDKSNMIFTAIINDEKNTPKTIGVDISYYNKILDDFKFHDLKEEKSFEKIDQLFVNKFFENYTEEKTTEEKTKNNIEEK